MTWVLLAPNGEVLACGSWQSVVEAGEEDGVIHRRFSEADGFETAPVIRRGYVMAPRGVFPEVEQPVREFA